MALLLPTCCCKRVASDIFILLIAVTSSINGSLVPFARAPRMRLHTCALPWLRRLDYMHALLLLKRKEAVSAVWFALMPYFGRRWRRRAGLRAAAVLRSFIRVFWVLFHADAAGCRHGVTTWFRYRKRTWLVATMRCACVRRSNAPAAFSRLLSPNAIHSAV